MALKYDFDRLDERPRFYSSRNWDRTPRRLNVPRDVERYVDDLAMLCANVLSEDCEKNALATYQYNMAIDRDLDNSYFEEIVQFAVDIMEMEAVSSRNRRPDDFLDSSANLAVRLMRAELLDDFPELEREINESVRRDAYAASKKSRDMKDLIHRFQDDARRDLDDDHDRGRGRDNRDRDRGRDDRDYRDNRGRDGVRRYGNDRDDRNDRNRDRGRDRDDRGVVQSQFGFRDDRGIRQGAVRSYGGGTDQLVNESETQNSARTKYEPRGGVRPMPGDRDDDRPVQVETNREVARDVMRRGTERFRETVRENERQQEVTVKSEDIRTEKPMRNFEAPILTTITGESEMDFMAHNAIYPLTNENPEPMAKAYTKLLTVAQGLQFGGLIEEQLENLIDSTAPGKMTQEVDMAQAVDAVLLASVKSSVEKCVESAPEERRIYRTSTIVTNVFAGRTQVGDLMRRLKRCTSLNDMHRTITSVKAQLGEINSSKDPSASDVEVAIDFIDNYITKEFNRYMTDVMGLDTPGTKVMDSWLKSFQELPDAIGANFHERQVGNLAQFCTNLFKAINETINSNLKADESAYEMMGVDPKEIGLLSLPRIYHFTVLPFSGKEMGYGTIGVARINGTVAPLIRALAMTPDALTEATSASGAVQVFVTRDRQAFELYRDPLNSQEYMLSPLSL